MPRPARPIVVVGAGLAALAAALRLAKLGHETTLLTDGASLGGSWAPGEHDLSATSISFPAPWRDLFRKSGRTLEEELARRALQLAPARAPTHRFTDGTELVFGGRAESHSAVRELAGSAAADAWQQLIDELAKVWQRLRFLGLETPLRSAEQLDARTREAIWADRSLADLAGGLPDPRLSAVVADLAAGQGSAPENTPAFIAVELFIEATFGRWAVVDQDVDGQLADQQHAEKQHAEKQHGGRTPVTGPRPMSSVVELLTRRLELRRVQLRTDAAVAGVAVQGRGRTARTVGLVLSDGSHLPAEAVVLACPPWRLVDQLPTGLWRGLGTEVRREQQRLGRGDPALAPRADRHPVGPVGPVGPDEAEQPSDPAAEDQPWEVIEHGAAGRAGRPRVWERRCEPDRGLVEIVRDHDQARPDPAAGLSWAGFDRWLDRAPAASSLAGLHFAGPWTRSGIGPERELLSAALAVESVQRRLDPADR